MEKEHGKENENENVVDKVKEKFEDVIDNFKDDSNEKDNKGNKDNKNNGNEHNDNEDDNLEEREVIVEEENVILDERENVAEVSEMSGGKFHEVDIGVDGVLEDNYENKTDLGEQESRFEDDGGIVHEEGYSILKDGERLTVEEGTEIAEESLDDYYEYDASEDTDGKNDDKLI